MASKLSKLAMPKAKSPEMEADELDMLMAEDAPAEEGMEMSEEASMLETVSDEELMAELKKRGLMSSLESGEEEADPAAEMEI